jgi:hypothetical protein
LFDARVHPRRHEAWKILGIRKEKKNMLNAKRHPTYEFLLVNHLHTHYFKVPAICYPQKILKARKMKSEQRPKESLP